MFRLLVVDDNPADVLVLKTLMKDNIRRAHEVFVAVDGKDALDFLYGRGRHRGAPRPNLILLDINMPGMSGLEVLAHIKNNPSLSVIPVIVLSSSKSPAEIRQAYTTHANCYIQKPTDLDRSNRLIRAIEAFWMDVAVLPPDETDQRPVQMVGA